MKNQNRLSIIILMALALGMLVLTFSSSAFYRLFCERTGHGGTPRISSTRPTRLENRVFTVRFNADIDPKLPWQFKPLQRDIKVKAGERGLAFYYGKNLTNIPSVGMATYNVTPHKAGIYFTKMECFCFLEQYLEAGQETNFPVQFFIDPDIVKDPSLDDVETITLSYTFFKIKSGESAGGR